MTKDEMLNAVTQTNYDMVQQKLKEAMARGATYETFCRVDYHPIEGWEILESTIERLKEDGFTVTEEPGKFDWFDGTIKIAW